MNTIGNQIHIEQRQKQLRVDYPLMSRQQRLAVATAEEYNGDARFIGVDAAGRPVLERVEYERVRWNATTRKGDPTDYKSPVRYTLEESERRRGLALSKLGGGAHFTQPEPLPDHISFSINVPIAQQLAGFAPTDVATAVSLLMCNGYHSCPENVSVGPEEHPDSIVWTHPLNGESYQLSFQGGWFKIRCINGSATWNAHTVIGVFARWWECS